MLKDIKVLELAGVLAGPSVGMFLAEMGAEVIKLENHERGGDITRSWKLANEGRDEDISAYFAAANWGKQSLCVNLADVRGQALVHDMLPYFDIVIASYKAGDALKLMMDYNTLSNIRQDIIYASISGYGESNARVAYDAVLQADTGFMSMNGTEESGPLKMPVAMVDILAAHQMKEAILMAIIKRLTTQEGSYINISLYDSAVTALANQATNTLMNRYVPGLEGSIHPNIAPYGETFKTLDGRYLILAVGSNQQFAALCEVLGLNGLAGDVRFKNNIDRVSNRKVLATLLATQIQSLSAEELIGPVQQRQVPAGMVKKLDEVLLSADTLVYKEGAYSGVKQSVFNKGTAGIGRPPHLGEHTLEVLGRILSLDNEALYLLAKEAIISQYI